MGLLLAGALAVGYPCADPAEGAPGVQTTTSHYEGGVDPATLVRQGEVAGHSGAQGLVILDYGRPAVDGSVPGTMDYGGSFVSLASIAAATVSYIQGYFATAPPQLHLHVAIGTNDSCGTGQPCGGIICGCAFEPPSYAAWGVQFARAVEQAQSETNALKARSHFTDLVTVVAGDDAEPAYDPGYRNTYDLLAGYAGAVGGFQPSMIDFGSAEPGFWSTNQLLQIADGFAPDVAVPEIYSDSQASSWASLISFAASHGRKLTVFGVLTSASIGENPQAAYGSLLDAIEPITGQTAISWASMISH